MHHHAIEREGEHLEPMDIVMFKFNARWLASRSYRILSKDLRRRGAETEMTEHGPGIDAAIREKLLLDEDITEIVLDQDVTCEGGAWRDEH